MMWFFRHFWIFISYHIFLLNQVEGAIAIPPSNSAPLPLFCLSVCPSIGLLTTFSGFCTFADKSLGRNGIELEMQMFPDDLPLANIDADGYCCHFMRSSVRPTIHGLGFVYFIQSAWKKWPTIWHADVSRWLTLSIHGCLWILLLVCLSVHLSVCSFTAFSGGCAFFFLRLGLGQRRAVVIIGRWLLPSLVDTGDICCHYWQLILVMSVINMTSPGVNTPCLFITSTVHRTIDYSEDQNCTQLFYLVGPYLFIGNLLIAAKKFFIGCKYIHEKVYRSHSNIG